MIKIKNKEAIRRMTMTGSLLSSVLDELNVFIVEGVSTLDIDSYIAKALNKRGMVSMTKGYMGYRHVCCVSINDEVVHGVPSPQRLIKRGDLVKVDVCASWKGYCADMARPFYVGECIPEHISRFVSVAQQALDVGIEHARVGNHLTDISAAVQKVVESNGYSVVRDFAGHGIGKKMHEEPEILNYGKAGKGPIIRSGMTFAIEPMITVGSHDVYITEDDWTVKTSDKSLAMHVEDTVLVTEDEPVILTRTT